MARQQTRGRFAENLDRLKFSSLSPGPKALGSDEKHIRAHIRVIQGLNASIFKRHVISHVHRWPLPHLFGQLGGKLIKISEINGHPNPNNINDAHNTRLARFNALSHILQTSKACLSAGYYQHVLSSVSISSSNSRRYAAGWPPF